MVVCENFMLWRVGQDEDGETRKERITDCDVVVLAAEYRGGKFSFKVRAQHPDGRTYDADMDAKVLERNADINAWATACALGNWNLDNPQRIALKRYIHAQDGARRVITAPLVAGVDTVNGVFLARGHCVDALGNMVPMNERGTFKLLCADKAEREFRVDQMTIPHLKEVDGRLVNDTLLDADASAFSKVDAFGDACATFKRFSQRLRKNLGGQHGTLLLGWVVANLFHHEVMTSDSMFPLAYVAGKRESGKDTLARLVMDIASTTHIRAVNPSSNTTMKGVRNLLDMVCGVPFWMNELRANDPDCERLTGMLRSVFDGQSGVTATKERGGTNDYGIRRGVLLSGQDVLGDEALISRYMLIQCRAKDLDKDAYPDVLAMVPEATRAFSTMVASRNALAKTFPTLVAGARRWLQTATVQEKGHAIPLNPETRQATCWAIVLAGVSVMFGQVETFKPESLPLELLMETTARMRDSTVLAQSDGTMGKFWEELEVQHAQGDLDNVGPAKWVQAINSGEEIAIWVARIRNAYNTNGARKQSISASFVRNELQGVRGFLDERSAAMVTQTWVGGRPSTVRYSHDCFVFRRDNALPSWVNELAGEMPGSRPPPSDEGDAEG